MDVVLFRQTQRLNREREEKVNADMSGLEILNISQIES